MSTPARERASVLLVDDEPQVMAGISVHLRRDYDVHTASSGEEALTKLSEHTFTVVMSDMRMPGMTGAQLLAEVCKRSPDTTRLLLTGQADLGSAIAAINEGRIFRFLSKPIPPDQLRKAMADAVRQRALLVAERELLENTLRSSLRVLTEVLAMVNPEAFSCAARAAEVADQLRAQLGMAESWQVPIAAMLSQIGCVTLTPDTVRKAYAEQALDEAEARSFALHADVAHHLLSGIPRLDAVADMIRAQRPGQPQQGPIDVEKAATTTDKGAEIVRAALLYDRLARKVGHTAALHAMRDRNLVSPQLHGAFSSFVPSWQTGVSCSVNVHELAEGMVLLHEVRAKSQLLLAPAGTRIGRALLLRLKNFAAGVGVQEPIAILRQDDAAKAAPAFRWLATSDSRG